MCEGENPNACHVEFNTAQWANNSAEALMLKEAALMIREMLHDYRRLGYGASYWRSKYTDLITRGRLLNIEMPDLED